MTTGRERLIEAGFIGLSVFAPLFFGSVYPWGIMSVSAFAFLLYLLSPRSAIENIHVPKPALICISLVFLWLLIQSSLIVSNSRDALNGYVFWLSLAALFCACHSLGRQGILHLFWALALIGFAEAAYGLWQVVSGNEKVLWKAKEAHIGYVTGTFLNRNHFAGLLEMTLGIQVGLFLRTCHKRLTLQSVFLTVLLTVTLIALVKSGSRSGMASLVLSFLICLPFLWRRASSAVLLFIYMFVICLAGGVVWGWETLSSRMSELPEQIHTLEGRILGWKAMLPMLQDHLWTGIGLGNFKWIFPAYQPAELIYGWDHVHNDYLEIALETGLPAFVLILFFFGSLFRNIVTELSQKDMSSFALSFGALSGLAAIAIHGLTDFNFAIPSNLLIFILILGLTQRLLQFEREKITVKKKL